MLVLTLYRLLLPVLFMAAFPGWVVKMLKRGGLGTRLTERIGIYTTELESEPCGAVHFHAVSVGETMLALKVIRRWLEAEPERRFVLATGTATGHAVATAAGIPSLRVTYSPLDFRWMVRSYLRRFEPSAIVLTEGEVWPHLMLECARREIPVSLVNARMSPRSARRFRRFATFLRPFYSLLHRVALQEKQDADAWEVLGVPRENIVLTGSLKFDPGSGAVPTERAEFQRILDAVGPGKRVVLAASTNLDEEAWIATAIRAAAPDALPVMVPRHAERRSEVAEALAAAGFQVILKSTFPANSVALPSDPQERPVALVVDTTGELRDWTAHATVVIIGKSFLTEGGQNPAEAILAKKPVITGPHMENFQALMTQLADAGGYLTAATQEELAAAIRTALDAGEAARLTQAATSVLARHEGATDRILELLRG